MLTVIWRFTVKPDCRADFERHYGADGSWAALFRKGDGYLGTMLLRDTSDDHVFVTIDRWVSRAAFDAFKTAHAAAYAALDRDCEALTTHEAQIAAMDESDSPSG